MIRQRILIVSESDSIHNVIRLILSDEPYDIISVCGIKEGLSTLKDKTCEIILIDDNLTVISAYKSCLELKKHKKTRHIPILLMCSHPVGNLIIQDSMVNGVINKPLEMDLIRKLKEIHINQKIYNDVTQEDSTNLPADALDELLNSVHAQFKNAIEVKSHDISKINKLIEPVISHPKSVDADNKWMQTILQYLSNTPVSIEVDLNIDNIKVADVIKFQVGDFIPINKADIDNLNVKVEGVTKYKASCEKEIDFKSLRITKIEKLNQELKDYWHNETLDEVINSNNILNREDVLLKKFIHRNRFRRLKSRNIFFTKK